MGKAIFEDFEGYDALVREREIGRKYRMNYVADRDRPEPYIERLHPSRLDLRVLEIRNETPSTRTFRLGAVEGCLPPFEAGQYIALFLDIPPVRTSRPYSLSSPPNQTGYYEITVRRVEGGLVSNHLLDRLRVGDRIESSGPAGRFTWNPLFHGAGAVCLAGGSGVTPFMSQIREIAECGLQRDLWLFHGCSTLEEALFFEELQGIAARHPNIRYIPVLEQPPEGYRGETGLLTGALLSRVLGDLSEKTFYLCGPQGMYAFCLPELRRLGIAGRWIRKEVYGPPQRISEAEGWPEGLDPETGFTVRVAGRSGLLEARAGEPLLATLEKAGLRIPSLCRGGECSMCRVKVLAGKVFQPAGTRIRRSDLRYGYVHACVAYPLEDLEILV